MSLAALASDIATKVKACPPSCFNICAKKARITFLQYPTSKESRLCQWLTATVLFGMTAN